MRARDKTIQLNKPGIPSVVVTKTAPKLAELNLATQDIWSAGFMPAEYVPTKMLEKRLFRKKDDYSRYGLWTSALDDKVCLGLTFLYLTISILFLIHTRRYLKNQELPSRLLRHFPVLVC